MMGKRISDEPKTDSQPAGFQTVFTLSEDETHELGRAIANNFTGGELLLLEGELGIGKTVFARGVAAGLGIAPEDVSSPSFTLVQEYRGGRVPMTHVDLYRLDDEQEIATLGLDEILGGSSVTVVEWSERLPAYYRKNGVTVRLHDLGRGARRIEMLAVGFPANPDSAD
jgi:tRNA threonylcarbamoyladenosine biosynthesis protein TsaE